MTYPIAETFHSIQGEGTWTGTPMFFIRLAGCNVGKYTPIAMQQPLETDPTDLRVLRASNPLHSVCTSVTGDSFLCDTDYHRVAATDEHILLELCGPIFGHVCITGGEPYLHDLKPLITVFQRAWKTVHIETSGTLEMPPLPQCWITCCPKEGFLPENYSMPHEWKFLVSPTTTFAQINLALRDGDPRPVYLQPIGSEPEIPGSVQRCWELLQQNPTWRLSAQLHKYLRFR